MAAAQPPRTGLQQPLQYLMAQLVASARAVSTPIPARATAQPAKASSDPVTPSAWRPSSTAPNSAAMIQACRMASGTAASVSRITGRAARRPSAICCFSQRVPALASMQRRR
jgi:hypothetical protein